MHEISEHLKVINDNMFTIVVITLLSIAIGMYIIHGIKWIVDVIKRYL